MWLEEEESPSLLSQYSAVSRTSYPSLGEVQFPSGHLTPGRGLQMTTHRYSCIRHALPVSTKAVIVLNFFKVKKILISKILVTSGVIERAFP